MLLHSIVPSIENKKKIISFSARIFLLFVRRYIVLFINAQMPQNRICFFFFSLPRKKNESSALCFGDVSRT